MHDTYLQEIRHPVKWLPAARGYNHRDPAKTIVKMSKPKIYPKPKENFGQTAGVIF